MVPNALPTLLVFPLEAINTPVNAINAQSSAFLKDKFEKLHALLSGKPVTVGDKQLIAGSHPQGLAFCKGFKQARGRTIYK